MAMTPSLYSYSIPSDTSNKALMLISDFSGAPC